MPYALSSLTMGFMVFMICLMVFVSILVPQMSIAENQAGAETSACLPFFFGQAPPSSGATPVVSTTAASLRARATRCVGNQAIVQAALSIVAHLHGNPDVNWDASMPEQVVN